MCRMMLKSRPEILSYAEQRVAGLEFIELYLSLDKIHHAFMGML